MQKRDKKEEEERKRKAKKKKKKREREREKKREINFNTVPPLALTHSFIWCCCMVTRRRRAIRMFNFPWAVAIKCTHTKWAVTKKGKKKRRKTVAIP